MFCLRNLNAALISVHCGRIGLDYIREPTKKSLTQRHRKQKTPKKLKQRKLSQVERAEK